MNDTTMSEFLGICFGVVIMSLITGYVIIPGIHNVAEQDFKTSYNMCSTGKTYACGKELEKSSEIIKPILKDIYKKATNKDIVVEMKK